MVTASLHGAFNKQQIIGKENIKKWQSLATFGDDICEAQTADISPDKQSFPILQSTSHTTYKSSTKEKEVSNKVGGKRTAPSVLVDNYENRAPNGQMEAIGTLVP